MARFGTVAQQYFNSSGEPLGGGKLYFYNPGTTDTKTVYSDPEESTAIAQPVVLDASGYQPDVFFSGQAKAVLTDANDVQVDVTDPVGDAPPAQFPVWVSSASYSSGAIVQGSDDLFYQSIGDSNQDNDPVSTPSLWIQLDMFRSYSASSVYNSGMVVYYSGALYYCETDGTTGVTPSGAESEWSILYGGIDLSENTVTGTLAEFNAALSDGSFASLDGAETLTNKTLDGPVISGAPTAEAYTITDGASVTIDAANGYRQAWALGADRAVTVSLTDGEAVRLKITGGGTWEISTWTGVDQWIGGLAPALAATTFVYLWDEGGTTYGAKIGDAS